MKSDIPERTFEFAKRVVLLCRELDKEAGVSRTLANQLLRSGTSVGANVEEGQASQSEADFIFKYSIASKEARETHYWLRLLTAPGSSLNPASATLKKKPTSLSQSSPLSSKNSAQKSHEPTSTFKLQTSPFKLQPCAFMKSSHEGTKTRRSVEEISNIVVDCGYQLHVEAGPGLLESVYEAVLARSLEVRGLKVERQVPVAINLLGIHCDEGFRADLLVEDVFMIELKSVERLAPVHSKQLLTYLRLMDLPMGLLMNFGAATFKEGCKRILNGQQDLKGSKLKINQG